MRSELTSTKLYGAAVSVEFSIFDGKTPERSIIQQRPEFKWAVSRTRLPLMMISLQTHHSTKNTETKLKTFKFISFFIFILLIEWQVYFQCIRQ